MVYGGRMTETEAPESPSDHHLMTRCSSCGDPVAVRRRSTTGAHYCSKRKCLAAKQRFYYQRRRDDGIAKASAAEVSVNEKLLSILARLALGERVTCDECGRTDAVRHAPHPNPDWTGGCRALEVAPLFERDMANAVVAALFPKP